MRVPAESARLLLLGGCGLLVDPARGRRSRPPASSSKAARVYELVEGLGFVQLDSINVVERAHHHILWSRWRGYRSAMLDDLYRERLVFEHWTHDASLIPSRWFAYWRPRFERYRAPSPWMRERLGADALRVIAAVRKRIEAEGPLMSKDFEESGGAGGGWWSWKPQKAALEHLWRSGELAVAARVNFHKVYDLTERVLNGVHALPPPTEPEHVEWACSTAMERLGIATPRELAGFWSAIPAASAKAWCDAAARLGRIVPVEVEAADTSAPRLAFAAADWQERMGRAPSPPAGLRLLSPFDPLLRDRSRAARLFNFDYRFEAFVPAARRRYGYYVLPVLEGQRLVGRVDPKLCRREGKLEIRIWWEPGIKSTRQRRGALEEAVAAYADFAGATIWTIKPG